MRRPWYSYALLFVGGLALLGALFGPMIGATGTPPGGAVVGPDARLRVTPGGPLARAGARNGDGWIDGETIEIGPPTGGARPLRWKRGIPRSGRAQVRRDGATRWLEVRPAPPHPIVGLAWGLVGLLNAGLCGLALALFWQRPRDGAAVLLGLVLVSAPVFPFPGEPRLLALVLAAHFFTIFPGSAGPAAKPWRRFARRALLYAPFLVFGALAAQRAPAPHDGRTAAATGLLHALAIGYAGYGLARVLVRGRTAPPEQRPVLRTLALAAAAILGATLVGIPERLWVVGGQFVPAHLLPALLFSVAVGRLVFHLRAPEVRLVARRTLHYMLARWTLGSFFLLPGFLLVWHLGALSALRRPAEPGPALFYLLWMFVAALLLGKRQEVLRNLDRRFFRDAEAARQALIHLAHDLGGLSDPSAVLSRLEAGVREALRPVWQRFTLPEAPVEPDAALTISIRRGAALLGRLQLGPKESGEPYSAEERELLEAAGAQAAMAMENARLAAALLQRQRAELAARSAGVLAGAEEERRRLAADLHDGILPDLRAMAAEVERLKCRADGLLPDLERLEADLRATMDAVREVMEALRPSALDMLGLGDALESCLRRAAARAEPPLRVSVRRTGPEPNLTPEQSLALYRIAQEGIQNIVRHSGARHAGLELESAGDLLLRLWDDGRGLPPEGPPPGGRGTMNIRYRADAIGAEVAWQPRPGGGACLEVRLPLPAGAAAECQNREGRSTPEGEQR